jgi:hypothetical protein
MDVGSVVSGGSHRRFYGKTKGKKLGVVLGVWGRV